MSNTILPIEQILVYGNMPSAVFIKTQVWREARYTALTVNGNRCCLCGAGPDTTRLHVDHIKPRFLYPELCLDPCNLQVLCEECHTAKGIKYIDDCRNKLTKVQPVQMRDFLRLEQRHMVLAHRPPKNSSETLYLSAGVRAPTKNQRSRWSALVHFCFNDKRTYPSATQLRIGEFILSKHSRNHKYSKFLHNKHPDDFAFDIGGCLFPTNIRDLLADDQRGGDL